MVHERYYDMKEKQEQIICSANIQTKTYNGLFEKYMNPVITRQHIPIEWRYDINKQTNPYFMERQAVSGVLSTGAIYLNGKYYLAAAMEGNDRKTFYGIAESKNGIDNFRFNGKPLVLNDLENGETNVGNIRLTKHEDGYIYGIYSTEIAGEITGVATSTKISIVRTKDLEIWERLPNLEPLGNDTYTTASLHPEYVGGKYMFYIAMKNEFGRTASFSGMCSDINKAVIYSHKQIDTSKHDSESDLGAPPIKTSKGWLHIWNSKRLTKGGCAVYAYLTSLEDASKVIAKPCGHLIAAHGSERVGDMNSTLYCTGVIVNSSNHMFIYYSSGGSRIQVASTKVDNLLDFVFNAPQTSASTLFSSNQWLNMYESNTRLLGSKK